MQKIFGRNKVLVIGAIVFAILLPCLWVFSTPPVDNALAETPKALREEAKEMDMTAKVPSEWLNCVPAETEYILAMTSSSDESGKQTASLLCVMDDLSLSWVELLIDEARVTYHKGENGEANYITYVNAIISSRVSPADFTLEEWLYPI